MPATANVRHPEKPIGPIEHCEVHTYHPRRLASRRCLGEVVHAVAPLELVEERLHKLRFSIPLHTSVISSR